MPLTKNGERRQWVYCKCCGTVAFYDYVPFGLGNPIRIMPCGHGPFVDVIVHISAKEAKIRIKERRSHGIR